MNPFDLFKYVPLPVLRTSARSVAKIMNALPELSVQRIIDINLRLAFPELTQQERDTLSEDIIRNQALSSVESIKSWAMPPEWSLEQIHTVHNQDVLTEALADPNGMLAIVPHIGTWEVMNAWLNQFGSPTIMYKPIKNKLADDFILRGRERLNAKLVPTDASGVKAIFKTLKSGGFSIVLPDHVPHPSGGVNVPFFGVNTLTSTLAPKLASKTKCALVGLVCVRRENASTSDSLLSNLLSFNSLFSKQSKPSFDIYCTRLDDPKLYDKDLEVATATLNIAMQKMIEEHSPHYMWGYKRFKNMPIIKNPYKLSTDKLEQFLQARNA